MNKTIAAAFPLLLLFSTSALADNGEFVGPFNVKATSAGCNGYPQLGAGRLIRYFPPEVGDNGPETNVTIREWDYAGLTQNFSLDSGSLIGTTLKTVSAAVIGQAAFSGTAKMAINSQTPATIAATTKSIKIAGRIVGFHGDSACTVVFEATVYKNNH